MKDLLEVEFLQKLKEYGFEILTFKQLFKNIDLENHFMSKAHRIKFYHILYFSKALDYHFIDFKKYNVKDNCMIFLSKEQIHSFSKTTNYEGYIILFTDEFLKRNFLSLNDSIFNILLKPSILYDCKTDYKPIFKQLHDDYKSQYICKEKINSTLFNYIVLKASEDFNKQNKNTINDKYLKTFQDFKSILHENYYKNRNVTYYSNLLNISSKHLNTICKQITNQTAKQIIISYIILEAKRRLVSINSPIKQISYELGFIETTNFIKFFKKYTNISPSKFKEKNL
ncbi:AraC family transcriptional regulator [Malaciobacter marinus]|uniref:AraC family transcriptional regulator n=1 Tax=Malaciobacter marinus TaxID=505249 RepID=A0AB36ZXZ5_9BACT|nr:helix-turn-helix domain-containing protein [Malaciobacter marinus]PPK62706.1 AraC family transcriptional regulator [Malaciobacter marinus]